MASVGEVRSIILDVHRVITYFKGVYHAAEERQELFQETSTLLVTLKDTESLWSKHSTDEQDKVSAILLDVKDCLLKIRGKLELAPKFWKNILTWLMWPRQKPDIEIAIRKIRDYNKNLSELTILKIGEDVVEISDAARRQMMNDFIKELTPHIGEELVKTPVRVNEITEGTGHWFRNVHEYKVWSESSDGLLWVRGIQGCGKSGLANITSSELAGEAKKSKAFRVACIYCDHQNARLREADPMDIVMSLWAQLVSSTPDPLFDREFIETMRTKRTSGCSDHERKIEVFMHTAAKIGQMVLILDGLDEIPRDDERQAKVVEILKEIQRKTQQCRVLITSRPYKSIINLFKNDRQFELKASEIDLELYMRDRLSRADWFTTYDNDFCEKIIKELTPKCKGLFLLSKLFMDDVLMAESETQCFEIIKELPESAKVAYNKGLERLAQESPPPRTGKKVDIIPCIPIQALFWVTHVASPLTESQLKQALAIEYGDFDYDPKREFKDPGGISALCGGWIIVDPQDWRLRVAHKSVTDHLTDEDTRKRWFPSIQQHITRVLLQYLLFDCMKTSRTTNDLAMDRFLEKYPLCPYALAHWGESLDGTLETNTELWKLTERFLLELPFSQWNDQVRRQAIQALAPEMSERELKERFTPGIIDGQHWAVFFNLSRFLPILCERPSSHLDPIPMTPLGLAAVHNRETMAAKLLDSGVKVNVAQAGGRLLRTPLYDAIYYRNEKITDNLLRHSADMTLRQGDNDVSPLDLAYDVGREIIASQLATFISAKGSTKAQELQFLVRGRFAADLKIALQKDLKVNLPCENGKLALDYARELGDQTIVDILLAAGAVSKLAWPPVKLDSCPYPLNFRRPSAVSPLVEKKKLWDAKECVMVECKSDGEDESDDNYDEPSEGPANTRNSALLLELIVPEIECDVKSIVFETVSRDQGWSSHGNQGTYLGSTRSWLEVRIKHQNGSSQSFRIQHNVHASSTPRLHTNVWNLSDLELSSPRRAEFLRNIRSHSTLQITAHAMGGWGWENHVFFVQVRLYEEDLGKEFASPPVQKGSRKGSFQGRNFGKGQN